jgi:hypothetical protein
MRISDVERNLIKMKPSVNNQRVKKYSCLVDSFIPQKNSSSTLLQLGLRFKSAKISSQNKIGYV